MKWSGALPTELGVRRVDSAAGRAHGRKWCHTLATELQASGAIRMALGTLHAGASQRAGPVKIRKAARA